MNVNVRRLSLFALVLLAITLIPSPTRAAEPLPFLLSDAAPDCSASGAVDVAPAAENGDQTLSLEEIEKLVGKQNLCGIPCGRFTGVVCTFACGDAALCYHGYCIFQ